MRNTLLFRRELEVAQSLQDLEDTKQESIVSWSLEHIAIRDDASQAFLRIFLRNPQKDPGNSHGVLEFSDFFRHGEGICKTPNIIS